MSIITSTAERQAAVEFAKAAAMRPRIVGEALNKVAVDPDVEAAMFEILETQKLVESKAKITLVPERYGMLPELLASTARGPMATDGHPKARALEIREFYNCKPLCTVASAATRL